MHSGNNLACIRNCRASFLSTWSQLQHPARTSNLTRLWSRVSYSSSLQLPDVIVLGTDLICAIKMSLNWECFAIVLCPVSAQNLMHIWLLTLVGFVVRELDKPHHRVLSRQEQVPWLDPVFQKCWRPHPQPPSPGVWHHLHSNTETGERLLPSWTRCWIS